MAKYIAHTIIVEKYETSHNAGKGAPVAPSVPRHAESPQRTRARPTLSDYETNSKFWQASIWKIPLEKTWLVVTPSAYVEFTTRQKVRKEDASRQLRRHIYSRHLDLMRLINIPIHCQTK